MSEREAVDKLVSVAREHLPNTMINLFTALLTWLFGYFVFLPAAYVIGPKVPIACSLLLLAGFSIFMFRAFTGLQLLLESTSNVLASQVMQRWKMKVPLEQLRIAVKCLVCVIAALVLFALYSPFLAVFHASLPGLVLITIILWSFWMLIKAVRAVFL